MKSPSSPAGGGQPRGPRVGARDSEGHRVTRQEVVMFKVGDLAVYPAHGVGRIESIESKKIGGNRQDFYIMRIFENDMKIMIPVQNADNVGLRPLIAPGDISDVYEILKSREISVNSGTWNRRYREYMEKIKTGSIYELAEVLRDLTVLKEDKELSFGERKMLETARNLLIKELSVTRGVEEEQISEEIDDILQ
jgi:CarD family transcriptional regulator